MVKDPFTSLEILIKLGFERVLTSGQDSSVLEGLPTIKQLVEKVGVLYVYNSIQSCIEFFNKLHLLFTRMKKQIQSRIIKILKYGPVSV